MTADLVLPLFHPLPIANRQEFAGKDRRLVDDQLSMESERQPYPVDPESRCAPNRRCQLFPFPRLPSPLDDHPPL